MPTILLLLPLASVVSCAREPALVRLRLLFAELLPLAARFSPSSPSSTRLAVFLIARFTEDWRLKCVESVGEGVVVDTVDPSGSWFGVGCKNDDAWEWARTGNGRLGGSGSGAGREVTRCTGGSCTFNAGVARAKAKAPVDFGKTSCDATTSEPVCWNLLRSVGGMCCSSTIDVMESDERLPIPLEGPEKPGLAGGWLT
jgi:hypothetical protein